MTRRCSWEAVYVFIGSMTRASGIQAEESYSIDYRPFKTITYFGSLRIRVIIDSGAQFFKEKSIRSVREST